ncbi:MAG: pantetheine-phosphate adenylyltransferase [Methylophilaceae bacterium]|nr:pantetheine-phosphate adenylyltransferase [Methylophilaceae bacterium]
MIAVYPGSFDPITLGHEDIIIRASKVFDEVVVGVAKNNKKNCLLTFNQRLELTKSSVEGKKNVSVLGYDGLTIDFLSSLDASVIIRGIRSEKDFIYESEISSMNYIMNKNIETFFLPSSDNFKAISSSRIREIYGLGGDISKFVSKNTFNYLMLLSK